MDGHNNRPRGRERPESWVELRCYGIPIELLQMKNVNIEWVGMGTLFSQQAIREVMKMTKSVDGQP